MKSNPNAYLAGGLALRKKKLVYDIQTALKKAGWEVSQKTISDAFLSDHPGKYCPALYGVWMHCHEISNVITALKKRGVVELSDKKLVSPSTEEEAISFLEEEQVEEDDSHACPYCGYADPDWAEATHCPNCEQRVEVFATS